MASGKIYSHCEITNWDDAKSNLKKYCTDWTFRGQRNYNWNLTTTIERLRKSIPSDEAEQITLTEFSRRIHLYYDRLKLTTDDTFEILALMQHHGAPTRLLDWTYSAYIASYFAFEEPNSESDKIAVWAMDNKWLREKTNQRIAENSSDPKLKYHDLFYANSNIWNREDFNWIMRNNRFTLVAPLEPYYCNERMTIQQGLFLVPANLKVSFMQNLESYISEGIADHFMKFVISNNVRIDALADLYDMNINRTSLFPGIDAFAQSFII